MFLPRMMSAFRMYLSHTDSTDFTDVLELAAVRSCGVSKKVGENLVVTKIIRYFALEKLKEITVMEARFIHYQTTKERQNAFRKMIDARHQWEEQMRKVVAERKGAEA